MDMESIVNDICEIQKTMLGCFKSEVNSGLMNVDAREAGDVADIIKDLTESKKNIREAEYYELVSKAMKEETEMGGYGYTPQFKPMVDQKAYMDSYMKDADKFRSDMMSGRMGYTKPYYGNEYDMYSNSKMYYTNGETSKKTDMLDHGKRYCIEAVDNIKEIWDDSEPQTKASIGESLRELMKYIGM